MFYGCELAENAIGRDFIGAVSRVTGADVAASVDLTGALERSGDWDLEYTVGTVETQSLAAASWQSTLAPPVIDLDFTGVPAVPGKDGFSAFSFSRPVITNDGQTVELNKGAGETALYENVGQFDGRALNIRATVISSSNVNPNFNLVDFGGGNDDNANVQLDAGGQTVAQAVVRWDIMDVNGNPVAANFTVLITDLDRVSRSAAAFRGEAISIAESSVDGYVLNGITDLTPSVTDGVLNFEPADNDPGAPGQDPTNGLQLIFTSTSSFVITYDRSGAQNFTFDGNFDPVFTDPATEDTNPNHADVFTEGREPVSIATDAIEILDEGAIQSATIALSNAQADDLLSVSKLPEGIAVNGKSTATRIILEGVASANDYKTAIKAVAFSNTSTAPESTVLREIRIAVTDADENLSSDFATTFVTVVDVPEPALDTDSDGVIDEIDLDDDNDGIPDVDEGLSLIHI